MQDSKTGANVSAQQRRTRGRNRRWIVLMGGLPAGRTNEEFRWETVPSPLQENFDADGCILFSALTNSGSAVGSIRVEHNQGTGGGDFQWISSDRRCAMCCFGATL